jgi:Tol biopolymer transport system component
VNPDDRATGIAARIADGSAIDWLAATSGAADPDERAILDELKAIAAVATIHRAPSSWPLDSAPSNESRWGPLAVVAPVGRGRFGDVHLAWDARLQRRVALKRLYVSSPSTAASPARAIEEARLLARVRHPNVLSVYGAECIGNQVGIWTEFIEGRTLEAVLAEDGPMPPPEVMRVGVDLARALASVHAAGLLHRDVKAQNVMRETGGRIVLMDFGTGQDVSAVSAKTGDLSGTPLYLAPEIFDGRPATAASDLYALGVLLFHLLTGEYPVVGLTLDDVRSAHRRKTVRTLRDVRADLPDAIVDVVARATASDPSKRYEDARSLELALESAGRAIDEPGDPTVGDTHVLPAIDIRRRAAALWMALAFGVTAALAVMVFDVGGIRARWFGQQSAGPAADLGSASMSVRKIDFPPHRLMGRPSHDGRYLPYVDRAGDVLAWEVETGISHRVTNHGASGQQGEWSAMSPDGRRVAYSWYALSGSYELRVANVDGTSNHQLLLPHEAGDNPMPLEWSRDGQYLLCLLPVSDDRTHLALVPANGAAPRILQTFTGGSPRNASLSPDGRFVVYDLPDTARHGRRGLFIAATDGSRAGALLEERANDLMPFWTPEGAQVFFTSDRSGSMDGWVLPVADGVAQGEPTLVARSLNRVSPLGLTGDGRYYYRSQTNAQDVFIVPIDLSGSSPPGAARRVSPTTVGGHIGPGWSPDGRFLSYITASGDTALDRDSNTLTIQDVQSGRMRDLAVPLRLGVAAPQWSPDGLSLLVRGSDLHNRSGRYRVDVRTGQASAVVLWNEGRATEYGRSVWSPDGQSVLYVHDERGIVARNLPTGEETELVPNAAGSFIGSFVVSSSGALALVVTKDPDGHQTIEVQPPGQPRRRVFVGNGGERLVLHAWTPDHQRLLITRFAPGSDEPHRLWTIAVADGAARDMRLSIDGNTQVNRLALSPDGRELAYTGGVVSWETWVMENFLPAP